MDALVLAWTLALSLCAPLSLLASSSSSSPGPGWRDAASGKEAMAPRCALPPDGAPLLVYVRALLPPRTAPPGAANRTARPHGRGCAQARTPLAHPGSLGTVPLVVRASAPPCVARGRRLLSLRAAPYSPQGEPPPGSPSEGPPCEARRVSGDSRLAVDAARGAVFARRALCRGTARILLHALCPGPPAVPGSLASPESGPGSRGGALRRLPVLLSLRVAAPSPGAGGDGEAEPERPAPPPPLRRRRRRRRRARAANSYPRFPRSSYDVVMAENQPPGTAVVTLAAKDPDEGDAGRLEYSMTALVDSRSGDLFSIDNATGAVVTTRALDRESMAQHQFRVTAADWGSPRRTATCVLTVRVADMNDHAPVFEQSVYRDTIRENVEEGYPVLQLRATDGDSADNANILYRIVRGDQSVFEMDTRSGMLTTKGVVDREREERYTLVVEANDQGKDPGPRSATVTVVIGVLDENDNYPQFGEKRYSAEVREDVRPHSSVLAVAATDADKDNNAQVQFSIISGNSRGHFSMDAISGVVEVISTLDYEVEREYTLWVRAQDSGRPTLSNNSGIVTVHVVDVNDNAPIFLSTPFQTSVLENAALGHSVLHIQAVDADAGENSRLTYSLSNLPAAFPFAINNGTGWITVASELDREAVDRYEFTVEARDHGSPSLSASASVSITVIDVNDNKPEFTHKTYHVRLNEDAAVSTSVLTVTATDRDSNSVISYQISSGNTRSRFAMTSQSGGGLVTVALPLDYKQERRYVLTITASDGTLADTAQVFVNITDANTHRPVFQSSHYSVSVHEDRPVGSTVVVISATDEDMGENARITYFMEDNVPQFRIEPNSGAITTLVELDYEDRPTYTLAITAKDNGIPQKSDTTYVEIMVSDVNDNAPKFLRDHYRGSVLEDAPPFSSVLTVSATDRDSGLNGRVQYTFQGGEDGDGDFTVESTSGLVRTVRRLDRENVAVYNLRAFAVDRGSPPLRTAVDVVVTVLDVNDNPPIFELDEIPIYVKENSPVGSVVGHVTARDPDEGPNAQVMYQIIEGNIPEVFQLDIFSGELTVLTDLDYEARSEFVIVVQATSAPLVSRATVRIHVEDQNDNSPSLSNFEILFNNYVTNKSNSFPVGVIGRVPAHDPDVSDRLTYAFERGNEFNLLVLNRSTGELRLSSKLDNNRRLVAVMRVSVTDGVHSVSAQCVLRVAIITDDMLTNSITVRLENMSQERFLSPLLSLFLDGVSAVLSTPKDDIFVFNVQNDTDVRATRILNVSFSALLPGGGHGQYFSSEELQEQVYLNRSLLARILDQRVLPFDDNICLREPCENYMKCVSVQRFDSSAPFISSSTVLFRPIHPVHGLRCRCPPGFTGDYCETEINLCYSNPCGSNGSCLRREGGYTCVCQDDYTGEHCEVNVRSGRCVPGVCRNGGTCVNLLAGGFKCECPSGGYEWPYCEVTARSFPPQSFVTFRGLRQRFRMTVTLTFATKERSGLLLYNGRFNEKHDFMALEIVDEQIQLTFSAGEKSTLVTPYVPGGVSDGQWHTVQVHYYNRPNMGQAGLVRGPSEEKVAVVSVDDCDTSVAVKFGSVIGNYSCAAQGRQTGSKKSLDLTGPLLLGGVPNLPEEFPVRSRQFVGCMRDLQVDSRRVDMAGFIANNGTLPGCSAKKDFCVGDPCGNGGTCANRWESYSCECRLGFGGKNCSQVMSSPLRFLGNSRVSWELRPDVAISSPWFIGLMFRTRQSNATLLHASAGQYTSISLQVEDGTLVLGVQRGSGRSELLRLGTVTVNDGDWHSLQAELRDERRGKEVRHVGVLSLDHGLYQNSGELGGGLHGLKLKSVHVGGLLGAAGGDSVQHGFRGCMQGVRMGDTLFGTVLPSLAEPQGAAVGATSAVRRVRVESGCSLPDPCDSSPCPPNSYCNDDWDSFSCVCEPGYYGQSCTDACSLNPCENQSSCRRKPSSSHGYTCECGDGFFGQYCESRADQPCPKGWWGNKICGPCNCDSSRGFDSDCNKSTGQCSCMANHYRPNGSESCFPCKCYVTGALSRTCDGETGQCPCKPGVVGQQCDLCDNPFAEVAASGCEVYYDGCPRAMAADIWWPRTKFGLPAAVPCPKDSFDKRPIGTAVRHCDDDKGWLPPNLYNCTSVTYTALKETLERLERNETRMIPELSRRLAHQLHNATRHTARPFGSDVRVAYQLAARVLTFESDQNGFNLSATQDTLFTENMVHTGSALLEPRHRELWEQLQRAEGGTARLLRLYEEYAQALARNMMTIYLKPFAIVTPNLVLSVERVDKHNFTGDKFPRYHAAFFRGHTPWDTQTRALVPESIFLPPVKPSERLGSQRGGGANRKTAGAAPRPSPTPGPDDEVDATAPPGAPAADGAGGAAAAASPAEVARRRRHQQEDAPHAVLATLVFRSLGELLPQHYDSDRRSLRLPKRPVINAPVLSVTVFSETELSRHSLEPPVLLEFRLQETHNRSKPICVFWNHSIPVSGEGGWSARGCELHSRNSTHITCRCNHMSSYALLMDMSNRELENEWMLTVVTYAAVSVSLLFLLVAFLVLLCLRSLRSNRCTIHKNLIVAIFFSELIFLIGINQTENQFACTVIAILLHYFFMCTFAWMFVEGLHVYRMLTEMRNINHGHMRFYYSTGWGVPAVITGLAVGLDPEGYGNPDFCWLSVHDTLIWSFAGPVCFVALMNIIIFIMAARESCAASRRGLKNPYTMADLRTAFLLLLLVSTTWLLGLLAVNNHLIIFHYLFAIFNSLQGFFILLFHCILDPEVREAWRFSCFGKKRQGDDTGITTKTSLLSRSLAYNNASAYEDGTPHRINIGTSTVSSVSTGRSAKSFTSHRDDLKHSAPGAQAGATEFDSSLFHNLKGDQDEPDSDSDSELSLDEEHSISLASTHSSDSEEEEEEDGRGYGGERAWDTTPAPAHNSSKGNGEKLVHSTPKVEYELGRVKPYWPGEFVTTASESEGPAGGGGTGERLRIETKVNIEPHPEGSVPDGLKLNGDGVVGGARDAAPTPVPAQTEIRKGILKNRVPYPTHPSAERRTEGLNAINRIHTELAGSRHGGGRTRAPSAGSSEGSRTGTGCSSSKFSSRQSSRERLNGINRIPMSVTGGSAGNAAAATGAGAGHPNAGQPDDSSDSEVPGTSCSARGKDVS
ncbi:cadherin EGF LAG seven-pass G-type receptor 2-like isoform X2 [Lampetra fluviatilis]